MIKYSFNRIVYRKPKNYKTQREISEVIGFDSETYTDGKPFMFCTSLGDTFGPNDVPKGLFTRKYRNANFGVWNLKFDAGSILHDLPAANRTELREMTRTTYNGYKYRYIPHKFLRISQGKNGITFWDINTFFHSSLDRAAKQYIGDGKKDIETKTFSPEYVSANWKMIKSYCIHDAVLVSKLYKYFHAGLNQIGVHPKNLYSCASISYHYFQLNTDIVTVWRYWEYYRDLLRAACESYNGGKFEVYTRGRINAVTYDINSAYPFEIARLKDITGALAYESKDYDKDADYGFIRCTVDNTKGLHVPCAVKWGPCNIYPAGVYNTTVTKQEYDYMRTLGLPITIRGGWWIICKTNYRPYKKVIDDLYRKKTTFKGTDERMYMLSKIMMNGFYGKMIQLVENEKGQVLAGESFNPIYAAIITANTRIRITDICNQYRNKVLAVHTDSVMLKDTLPSKVLGSKLGLWSKETEGDGILISCGVYQIGDKCKFRGIEISKKDTWTEILKRNKSSYKIPVPQQIVLGWMESNFRGKDVLTNRFLNVIKTVDLNADTKRLWGRPMTAGQYLTKSQRSTPHIIID